ncbi:MAG TPA: proton-conducting transporter membrane subunit [Thermomicrobiales bacterium]|nr:proton-conducting transporter membrane subunit [Thermomicrobiales bacterium]
MIALPLAILWFGGLVLALLDGTRKPIGYLGVAVLASATAATAALGVQVHRDGQQVMEVAGWDAGTGIALRVDMLGIVFAIPSLVVLTIALWFEVSRDVKARIFPALAVFMGLGLTGLFFTGDAFNFYVFFEISMVSAYVLASYGETPRQLRAAMIFIVVNLLGSVLFLIAIAGTYHNTGWLDMERIAAQTPLIDVNPAIMTATLIFVAFSIKLGLFPFHFWLPAVYTGTRPAVAAMLSGALANIGSYGLLRFGADIFSRELHEAATILFILGTLSIIYGSIQAIARHTPAEVLAYSSIGQVGYILIALAIGGEAGYVALIVFAVINALNKLLLFLSASLRGWIAGAAFAVGAFSVAGVPPAGGFFGKMAVFQASIGDQRYWLVAVILIGGALSFVYMFQIYGARFWTNDEADEATTREALMLVVLVALVIIAIGVFPGPLFELSRDAATNLPERVP